MAINLYFTPRGANVNLGAPPGGVGAITKVAALATGFAYYHRHVYAHENLKWEEPPTLLNPFWHATLVPIDFDENPLAMDKTPLIPARHDADLMLGATPGLTLQQQQAEQRLRTAGFRGWQ
jgi:hypothetical protein